MYVIKRLTEFSAIQILDEEVSYDLNTTPLYLYEFGSNKMFVRSDSTINSRSNSFSVALSNRILSTIPDFYPDSLEPDYHNNHNLTVLINPTLPLMQYKKVRLLFANGFGYGGDKNAITIRISFIHTNNGNSHTDLVSLLDLQDSSNITITPANVFFNGVTYSQMLEFLIPDVDFMYNSTDADIIEIRELAFGSDKPTIFKISTSLLSYDQINELNRIIIFDSNKIASIPLEFSDIDTDVNVNITEYDNRIDFTLVHENNYDIPYVIKQKLKASSDDVVRIDYNVNIEYFDSNNDSIGTYAQKISNNINKYDAIKFIPILSDLTVSIVITIYCVITNTENGFSLIKQAQKTISDADVKYKITQDPKVLSLDSVTLNLIQQKNITNVEHIRDYPKVLYVNKNVFFDLITYSINVYPYAFAIKFDNIVNISDTVLVIGDEIKIYPIKSNDTYFFNFDTITSNKIISKNIKRYFLVNKNDNSLIKTGDILAIK